MQPLVIRPALASEMDEIFRLRHNIFCDELKVLEPDPSASGKETDRYDARSYHAVAVRNGRIIGYFRLILPVPGEKFLIEESVTLPGSFDRDNTVEVSRGLVVADERMNGVISQMIDAVFTYCRDHGFPYLLSFSNKVMVDTWQKKKAVFLYKGNPMDHCGFMTWPLIISVI